MITISAPEPGASENLAVLSVSCGCISMHCVLAWREQMRVKEFNLYSAELKGGGGEGGEQQLIFFLIRLIKNKCLGAT